MPVDFGILAQTPSIGARYAEGLQLAQAEQERNMLRGMQMQQMQMQRENMLAQRGEREAQAKLRGQQELELKARMERATREEGYLNKVGELFANNGMPLTLQTAQEGLQYAIKSGNRDAIAMMDRAVTGLQEREALKAAFGGPAAPAAPSMMRQPPVAAAPAAPTNMFAGTMADIGTTQPAPVNALAAPPQPAAPAAGGMSREQLQAIILNPNAPKAAVERAKAVLTSLPQTPAPAAPSEVVKLNRELAAANAAGDTALAADLKARIKRLTEEQKGTTVKVEIPPQEKAERGERGKLLVEQYKVVSDAARLATRTLPALETQERVLDAGFRTGFGAEAQKAGASLLAALGVPEAKDYATNAQTFSAAMSQAVLQKQLEQKGTQTKADADRIEQTGAQLTNTTDANRFIINVARAQLKRDIAQRNFYDKWWKENKTYDGAEDAWATGEGNKSLFEDPALKKFAPAPAKPAPTAAPATTGVQPFSDAAKERRYQEWKRSQ